jgi:hypothetical protein
VGFNATSGLGQVTSDPKEHGSTNPDEQPFTIEVRPSYLLQTVIGFDLIRRGGFTMQGAVGYAALLNHDTVRLVDGSLTSDDRTAIDVFFKGGPVVSVAFGSAFE